MSRVENDTPRAVKFGNSKKVDTGERVRNCVSSTSSERVRESCPHVVYRLAALAGQLAGWEGFS